MAKKNWAAIKRTQRAYPITRTSKCENCAGGYLLGRHHVDRDRENITKSNVRILCMRCHVADHVAACDWGTMKRVKA